MPKKQFHFRPQILLPGKDYTLNLPKPHLSFSQIDLYQQCPEKYRRQYVLGEKTPPTTALVEGSAMSLTMEATNKNFLKNGRHLGAKVLLKKWKKFFDIELKKCHEWDDDPGAIIERAGEFLNVLDLDFIPVKGGVEEEFTIEIAGVPVNGFIDLVEERTVWDYKVAKTTRFYDPERSLQLSIYAVAKNYARVGYIVFCKKSGKIEFLTGDRDIDRTRRWLEVVVSNIAKAISEEVFPPKAEGNFLCADAWCPYFSTCYGAK